MSIFLSLLLGAFAPPPQAVIRAPANLPPGLVAPHARGVVRSRLVEVDPSALAARHVTFDLFDGRERRALLDRTSRIGGAEIFEGALQDDALSSIVLSVLDDQMFGNIKTADRWYQIRHVADGIHAVVEMDASLLPAGDEPLLAPVEASASVAKSDTVAADDGTIIDVLVMYTPNARASAGGAAGIANLISTAIAETNTAYQNSAVTQRVRLVHTAETVNWLYEGTAVNADNYSFGNALTLLRGNGDGAMDEAHALRNTYGADAVALIMERSDSCGIAYVMTTVSSSFESSAFSVTARTCATGYYSFGHELGHNMGLAHDRANSSGAGAFSYAYGWQNPSGLFRTIMGYACPGGCPRVQHFSNPNVNYNGSPTGSPLGTATEAHNALALNNTALTFSNFRASVIATLAAPQNVVATTSAGVVNITWTAVSGATSYQIQRRAAGGTFSSIGTSAAPAFSDLGAGANQAYLYRVSAHTATDSSPYSAADPATTVAFTDAPLSSGVTVVKAAHLAEIRTAANALRTLAGLDAAIWTDSAAPGLAVKAVHVTEVRTAVDEALTALSFPLSGWASGATAGSAIGATHFQQIRDRLR